MNIYIIIYVYICVRIFMGHEILHGYEGTQLRSCGFPRDGENPLLELERWVFQHEMPGFITESADHPGVFDFHRIHHRFPTVFSVCKRFLG